MLQDRQGEFQILWIKLTRHKRLSQHQICFTWRNDPGQGAQCPKVHETQTESLISPSLRDGNQREYRHKHRKATVSGLPSLKYLNSPIAPVSVCLAPILALAMHQWEVRQSATLGPDAVCLRKVILLLLILLWFMLQEGWPQVKLSFNSLRLKEYSPLNVTVSFLKHTEIFQGKNIFRGEEMYVKFRVYSVSLHIHFLQLESSKIKS